jgi:hypothetical protein
MNIDWAFMNEKQIVFTKLRGKVGKINLRLVSLGKDVLILVTLFVEEPIMVDQ